MDIRLEILASEILHLKQTKELKAEAKRKVLAPPVRDDKAHEEYRKRKREEIERTIAQCRVDWATTAFRRLGDSYSDEAFESEISRLTENYAPRLSRLEAALKHLPSEEMRNCKFQQEMTRFNEQAVLLEERIRDEEKLIPVAFRPDLINTEKIELPEGRSPFRWPKNRCLDSRGKHRDLWAEDFLGVKPIHFEDENYDDMLIRIWNEVYKPIALQEKAQREAALREAEELTRKQPRSLGYAQVPVNAFNQPDEGESPYGGRSSTIYGGGGRR